jgi:hypothetical protein
MVDITVSVVDYLVFAFVTIMSWIFCVLLNFALLSHTYSISISTLPLLSNPCVALLHYCLTLIINFIIDNNNNNNNSEISHLLNILSLN